MIFSKCKCDNFPSTLNGSMAPHCVRIKIKFLTQTVSVRFLVGKTWRTQSEQFEASLRNVLRRRASVGFSSVIL